MPATLKSRLPLIAAELRPRVGAAIKDSADRVVEGAQLRVPRDSEDLYQAIHAERKGPASYAVIAGDDGEVFYGHFVEFGTVGTEEHHATPAQPFLLPALEAEVPSAIAQVTGVLRLL